MHVKSCHKHVVAHACNKTWKIVTGFVNVIKRNTCNSFITHTVITCITRFYMHHTAATGQIVGLIHVLYRQGTVQANVTDSDSSHNSGIQRLRQLSFSIIQSACMRFENVNKHSRFACMFLQSWSSYSR
jgi:hypothetical protein